MTPKYGIDPKDPLPRYYQVYLSLQERIRGGEFRLGEALPSERQLVKDYGVSRITIVKAMDLLERDQLIEQQQGRGSFVLNHEEPVPERPPSCVAFCMPTFVDSYITAVLIGAARVAMREGVQLEIIGVEMGDREPARVRGAIESGADGVVLFPRAQYPDAALYRELRESRYPIVLVDRYYREADTDWVVFDDEGAGYALTQLLLAKGHRRIAIFPGDEVRVTSVHRRIRGYQRALEEAGLAYDEDLVCLDVYETLSPASLYQLKSSYKQLAERIRCGRFTGMVAINQIVASQMSVDLMRIRAEHMQAVIDGGDPRTMDDLNVAIVAISDKHLAHDHGTLVALAIHSGEVLGERAMELMVQRLEGYGDPASYHLTVPMQVVEFG